MVADHAESESDLHIVSCVVTGLCFARKVWSPDRAADLRQRRRNPRLRRRRIPIADRESHLLVGVQRMRPRRPRHQALVRATAQDLGDHLAEGQDHVVAAGIEDQVAELDFDGEEVDEGAGLAEAAEIHRELGDARALGSRRQRAASDPAPVCTRLAPSIPHTLETSAVTRTPASAESTRHEEDTRTCCASST
jgi:hypothetical protein